MNAATFTNSELMILYSEWWITDKFTELGSLLNPYWFWLQNVETHWGIPERIGCDLNISNEKAIDIHSWACLLIAEAIRKE